MERLAIEIVVRLQLQLNHSRPLGLMSLHFSCGVVANSTP